MENQGNMQSGKKAAVIYFLAAFFIACIGIAGANYLKGELGLSAEELVKSRTDCRNSSIIRNCNSSTSSAKEKK